MNSTSPLARTDHVGKLALTLGYYGGFIVLGLITGVFGPTLPGLAQQTRVGLAEISIIFLTRALGYLAGALLSGRVFDRLPGNLVLAGALVCVAATFVLIPLAPTLVLLVALVILLGLAEGAIDVGGNALLLWVHRDRVGPFLNGLHFCFGIGAFLSPIVIAEVVRNTGEMHWAFWLLASAIVPIALWLARLPSPAVVRAKTTTIARTNPVLVLLAATFLFLYASAEVGFGNWVFTYATTLSLADPTNAAYLSSAFWGSFTLGRLFGVAISLRVKPAIILLSDLGGCLVCAGVIVLFPESTSVLWSAAIGLGIFMASIFPTTLAFAETHMTMTARVTAWFFFGAGIGVMFMPWVIGQLFEPAGARVMPRLVLATLVLNLIWLGILVLVPRWQKS